MSVAGFVVFLVLLLTVLVGINLQVFRWARNAFGLGQNSQRLLKTVLWLSIAGTVLGRVAGRFWPGALSTGVIAVSSTVQLAAIISGVLLMVVDSLWLLARSPRRVGTLLARLRGRDVPAPQKDVPASALALESATPAAEPAALAAAPPVAAPPVARRAFLTQAVAGSAFLIGSSSSLYGALKGRHDYSIEEAAIKLPGFSRSLDGFTIVQLSDVHIGAFTGAPELAAAEALVRQAKPDLIVLTGDLLDNDVRLAGELGRFVRRLSPLAREGVVAITGNHDYFAGADEMASAVRAAGGRILRNQGVVVGGDVGFALLGVDDVYARRKGDGGPDLLRAAASLPTLGGKVSSALDLPRVLLCHNPSFFEEAAGQVALQLSGHTHGGQVNLGIRPADFLLPGAGLRRYDMRGSALYVNRGFGVVGPPARIGAPPEVTRVVLTA